MTRNAWRTAPFETAAAAVLALATGAAPAQTAAETELARKLDQLTAELADVKAQLARLQQPPAAAPAAPAPASAAAPAGEGATVVTSYGEVTYTRPNGAARNAQADLRRFIFGYQHRFDPTTRLVTEVEIEHAVSSAGDAGEVAIEQAYVERLLSPAWAARVGLFVVPVGMLNEAHEPNAFYGVDRNFVETAIIPTTWREGGLQIVGTLDNGLTLQGGVSTGFDLTKWDAASTEGTESPLGSIHQELSLAKARDLSVFGAVNWRGIPGLLVGGSLFTGGAAHAQGAAGARVTLWDAHVRWTPGRWDLAALYSRGRISGTAAANAPLVGNPTLIPRSFDGWYAQVAYKLWSHRDYALAPFVRHERFNTARSFADLGAGLTPVPRATERVTTLGANLQVAQGVVIKADVQRFRRDRGANRFDLGLGWSF